MDAKKSQLSSELYYKDSPGSMETMMIAAADDVLPNHGLQLRCSHALQSRKFDMIGCIHGNIFFQERYLLNEVGMWLVRSKDAFCLVCIGYLETPHNSCGTVRAKGQADNASIPCTCKYDGTAKYPIKRMVCKVFAIPQNYRHITYKKLVSGQLPMHLIVGIVDSAAFNGTRDRNLFNFQHYN